MKKSIFVHDQGKGESLVFIHGFCETSEVWDGFTHPFADKYRIITIDLPGFGRSEMLQAPFTIDQVGDAVATALIQHEISDALIIGHSLGGYVALSLLQHHQSLVKGIALFHSSVFADTPEKKDNRNKVIEFVGKHGVPPFLETFVPGLFFDKKHPMIDATFKIASKATANAIQQYTAAMRDRPDRSSLWKESPITKLVIAGIEDSTIPIKISEEMGTIGQDVSLHKLENTGHMGFFEAKTETQAIIARFANKVLG